MFAGAFEQLESVDIVYKYNNTPWIGHVHCDASLSEMHSETGEATEHPVEDGSNISDHYRSHPRTVRIEGLITNQPVRRPLSQVEGVQEVDVEFTWEEDLAIAGVVGIGVNAIADLAGINKYRGTARGFEPEFDRVGDGYDELSKMVENGEVVTIVTPLRAYDNMVIESLEVTEVKADKYNGNTVLNSIKFMALAKQIRTVSTELVKAPAPEPTTHRGKPTENKGKQATKALDSTSPAGQQSVAKKLLTEGLF